MIPRSPSLTSRYKPLTTTSVIFAILVLGAAAFSAAAEPRTKVRLLGQLTSGIAPSILGQVNPGPFTLKHDSPILLQGTTLSGLRDRYKRELTRTYRAGYSIVLLDATMAHIQVLHGILGASVNLRSQTSGRVLAYSLRLANDVPTCALVAHVHRSGLQTSSGTSDPIALETDERAFTRAADLVLADLRRLPQVRVPGPPRDPSQPIAWQDNPLQTCTFHQTGQGVYTTLINVYALHRCLDSTDHYVVTAQADWTATDAKWQGASTSDGTLYKNGDEVVINWQDGYTVDYCASASSATCHEHVCRYINYPVSYDLKIVPSDAGAIQIDASPAATQGQQTSYQSGFSFSIGGTVNVSAQGPGGGISASATWINTTTTTVPPLIVAVSDTANEGVQWSFKYCTTGLEPDAGTDCTGHVQMVRDVCISKLGDPDSGSNPQQGQTPEGKFSNAVQSAHWEAPSNSRVGSTFDIEVAFTANLVNTVSYLSGACEPVVEPNQSCNIFNCACTSQTNPVPVSRSFVFSVPFPSTTCQQ